MKIEHSDGRFKNVKNGFSIIIEEQDNYAENNGGVRDTRLDLIGKRVYNKEYGYGYIRGVELFKGSHLSRYFVEITENIGKPILTSLFPDNKMGFNGHELKIID
jgi:hypothetical protein